MSNRINWIDWAKSFGIFLVILGHIQYPDNLVNVTQIIYGFHMPFFFLISGYLFKPEACITKKYLYRLIVPYISFNLLIFLIFTIPGYVLGDITRWQVLIMIKNTLLGMRFPISGPSWFLVALFWAVLANHIILKISSLLAIVLSVSLAVIGYTVYHSINFEIPFFICQGLLATPIVTTGYLLKKYNIINKFFSKTYIIIATSLLLIPIYIYLTFKLNCAGFVDCNLTYNPFLGILMATIGSYLFLLFCRSLNEYSNKLIRKISVGTIVVLGIHLDIYTAVMKLFSPNNDILLSLIVCSIIVVLCYFLIGIIQNNKILSILFLGKKYK